MAAQPCGVTLLQSGCSHNDRISTGRVPIPPCHATLAIGGMRSGYFFPITVPRPNSHAAASATAAPGSLPEIACPPSPEKLTPTISATPPQPSTIARIRPGVSRSPSIGQARIEAQIGSV